MIKFKVDKVGAYIHADSYDEFKNNVMDISDIVENLLPNMISPIESEQINLVAKKRMLYSFFNDPNRRSIRITESDFLSIPHRGYGVVNDRVKDIIMWFDDSGTLNFAAFTKAANTKVSDITNTHGYLDKIYVTDGDVFTVNKNEASDTMASYKASATFKNKKYDKELENADTDVRNILKDLDIYKINVKNYFKLKYDLYKALYKLWRVKQKFTNN